MAASIFYNFEVIVPFDSAKLSKKYCNLQDYLFTGDTKLVHSSQ